MIQLARIQPAHGVQVRSLQSMMVPVFAVYVLVGNFFFTLK